MEAWVQSRIDALSGLGQVDPTQARWLVEDLLAWPEPDLYRQSPLVWAKKRRVDESAAIDLFLRAAHLGLLDMEWGLVCPGCTAFLPTATALSEVRHEWWCGLCDAPAHTTLDETTGVGFTVAPSLRPLRLLEATEDPQPADALRRFFTPQAELDGVPFLERLARLVVQAGILHPQETRSFRLDRPAGRYVVLRPVQHRSLRWTLEDGAPDSASAEVFAGFFSAPVRTRPGGTLDLRVCLEEPEPFVLLRDPIAPPSDPPEPHLDIEPPMALVGFLSVARVLHSAAFRELYRASSLPGAGGHALRDVTFLFTDVAGSTSLYDALGDLEAYAAVRRHFEALRSAVRGHGGSVVKTMGDAVMATFAHPRQALAAMAEMLDHFRDAAPVRVRVGVHAGPCVAVEANGDLDYFGQTVNLACRLEGAAVPGEGVVSEAALERLGEVSLAELGLEGRPDRLAVRGILAPVGVKRLRSTR